MKPLDLPSCPFCGRRVNPIRAWYLKKEGEYRCPRCGNYSNVLLAPITPYLGALAVIISIIIFLITRALKKEVEFTNVIMVLIPFFIFFFLSVFFIRLRKPVYRKKEVSSPIGKRQRPAQQQAPSHIRISEKKKDDDFYHTKQF